MNQTPLPTPHPITDLPLYELPIPSWAIAILSFGVATILLLSLVLKKKKSTTLSLQSAKRELQLRIGELERMPLAPEMLDHLSLLIRRYLSLVVLGVPHARDIQELSPHLKDSPLFPLIALCSEMEAIRFAPNKNTPDWSAFRQHLRRVQEVLQS